jgi:hypothetical protein
MPISGTLTPEDYIAAKRLDSRPRPWLAVVGICLLAGALFAAVKSGDWVPVWPIGFLFAVFYVYMPYMMRRAFRMNAAMSDSVSLNLREGGLYFVISNTELLLQWNKVHRWRASHAFILIYTAAKTYCIVPRRFFSEPDTIEALCETLKKNVGKAT